jgi:hypothetical protein
MKRLDFRKIHGNEQVITVGSEDQCPVPSILLKVLEKVNQLNFTEGTRFVECFKCEKSILIYIFSRVINRSFCFTMLVMVQVCHWSTNPEHEQERDANRYFFRPFDEAKLVKTKLHPLKPSLKKRQFYSTCLSLNPSQSLSKLFSEIFKLYSSAILQFPEGPEYSSVLKRNVEPWCGILFPVVGDH